MHVKRTGFWGGVFCLLLLSSTVHAQQAELLPLSVVYKQVGERQLSFKYFLPANPSGQMQAPVVLIHGGGWVNGSPKQFQALCSRIATQGRACFSPEYRTRDNGGGSPYDALIDVRDAVLWLRDNAEQFSLSSEEFVLGGASAGGQLAAALALRVPAVGEAPGLSDLHISRLILINPVVDNSPEGFGNSLLGERWKEFSPYHHVHDFGGRTLILSGDRDQIALPKTLASFCDALQVEGSPCALKMFPDVGHGFFNYRDGKNPNFAKVLEEIFRFISL